MLGRLLVICLAVSSTVCVLYHITEESSNSSARFFLFKRGKFLSGPVLDRTTQNSSVDCANLCEKNSRCRSFNMRMEAMTCELSTGTEFDTSSTSLVDDLESTYYMKIPKDCADYNVDGGVFWIHVHSMRKAIQVYCERGWTVLLRRTGPELDFNRSWEAYKNGFGNIAHDHWLGLEAFHHLTNQGDYSLKIEVRDLLTDTYFWNIRKVSVLVQKAINTF